MYATRDTLPLVRDLKPDVVVHDILTLGPSLAGELLDIPRATLIPHVFPEAGPGLSDLLVRCAPSPYRRWARLLGAGPPPVRRGLRVGGWPSTARARRSACLPLDHVARRY